MFFFRDSYEPNTLSDNLNSLAEASYGFDTGWLGLIGLISVIPLGMYLFTLSSAKYRARCMLWLSNHHSILKFIVYDIGVLCINTIFVYLYFLYMYIISRFTKNNRQDLMRINSSKKFFRIL